MRRKQLSHRGSKKMFKKNTGIHKMNNYNRFNMRGGIRL